MHFFLHFRVENIPSCYYTEPFCRRNHLSSTINSIHQPRVSYPMRKRSQKGGKYVRLFFFIIDVRIRFWVAKNLVVFCVCAYPTAWYGFSHEVACSTVNFVIMWILFFFRMNSSVFKYTRNALHKNIFSFAWLYACLVKSLFWWKRDPLQTSIEWLL